LSAVFFAAILPQIFDRAIAATPSAGQPLIVERY